jgi:threonine/homoserine/homoserine lactone efflux protein
MPEKVAFALAVLTLLATPGPTNTLLAASGASAGVRHSLMLPLAEMAGYLISITLLAIVLGPIVAARPWLESALRLAAAAWLLWCAVQLWLQAGAFGGDAAPITLRRVFVTTLLNPKALIFALVIFPRVGLVGLVPWLAAFCGLVVIVALCWITLGSLAARSAGPLATPGRIWRIAAVGLAGFAAVIVWSAAAPIV